MWLKTLRKVNGEVHTKMNSLKRGFKLHQKWYTETLEIIVRKLNIDTKKVNKVFLYSKNKNE